MQLRIPHAITGPFLHLSGGTGNRRFALSGAVYQEQSIRSSLSGAVYQEQCIRSSVSGAVYQEQEFERIVNKDVEE